MKKCILFLLCALGLVSILGARSAAEAATPLRQVPVTVMTALVPGKIFTFQFSLYTAFKGGTRLWGPGSARLTVAADKTIAYTLGAKPAFGPAVDFTQQMWVQISGGGKTWRVPLGAAAYSLQSLSAASDSITALMLQDGAVTIEKIGFSCPEGEGLVYGTQGWTCRAPLTCRQGDFLYCFNAPMEKLNVGVCRPGTRACIADGTGFTQECSGVVLPAGETCNDLDDDCNGLVDDGPIGTLLYQDGDGDGYGNSAVSQLFCDPPLEGWAAQGGDCALTDPAINPGATEICDTKDNDCDTQVDEGCPTCGDDVCDAANGETNQYCPADCPGVETICNDAIDNDFDSFTDLDDPDCANCGDGQCTAGENSGTCLADCPVVCGDGIVAGDEECDDDGLADGDGCSSTCVVEPGYACSGDPSVCAPFCGDGLCIGEDFASCPADCSDPCGDNVCDVLEDPTSCPADCHLVINEVDARTIVSGQDPQEYMEIYNPTGTAISLDGYTLERVDGATGTIGTTTLEVTASLAAGGFWVVGKIDVPNVNQTLIGTSIQNGPDAVALRYNGALIDSVVYGVGGTYPAGVGEGAPAPQELDDLNLTPSIGRCPDGTDTNENSVDFVLTGGPTPGAANNCP